MVRKYADAFGKRFKERRREQGVSLREFCRENGFDHGNMSRIERGLAKPPTGDRLKRYLGALDVEPESDLWYELHDLAHACAGEIPPEIMEDEEIVKKLPVIFRTVGRHKPTDDELDKLVDIVKREMNGE